MGLKYQTFATWRLQRRRQRAAGAGPAAKAVDSVRWLEVVVEQAQTASGAGGLLLPLPWATLDDGVEDGFPVYLASALPIQALR